MFITGLYVQLNYTHDMMMEGFSSNKCPNLLIEHGTEIWLKNTSLAEVPGVNPVVFHNLHEYTQFMEWQKSINVQCPVLYLQKEYNAQNEMVYQVKPIPDHLKINTYQ
jgi:hypothetical protein